MGDNNWQKRFQERDSLHICGGTVSVKKSGDFIVVRYEERIPKCIQTRKWYLSNGEDGVKWKETITFDRFFLGFFLLIWLFMTLAAILRMVETIITGAGMDKEQIITAVIFTIFSFVLVKMHLNFYHNANTYATIKSAIDYQSRRKK